MIKNVLDYQISLPYQASVIKKLVIWLSILVGFYLTSLYNYLLFHSFVEIFGILVGCTIFVIAWNLRQNISNSYLLFIGIAYLAISILDLVHTLSYKGMSIFTDYDYYANQLWIAARYLEAFSLFAGFMYLGSHRQVSPRLVLNFYLVVTALILASVFYWRVFPICFIEGQGLTPFKKISEYIISGILLLNIALLYRNRASFEKKIFLLLVFSMVCTIVSELAFTFYISNYGFSNMVGHFFKIFSFYFVYEAIIVTCLRRPYELLFLELKKSESSLAEAQRIAQVGNWEWNIVDNQISWSDEVYRIFGWEPQSFVADYDYFMAAVHPEDRELVQEAMDNALRTPEAEYAVEHRLLRKDGSERIVQERGIVVHDKNGEPVRMLGIILDITEREKTREDLELYRLMIEKTADPVFLIDIEDGFRMAYVNEAAVRHYGAPREEILSWRIPDWDPHFVAVDDLEAHLAEMRAHPGLVIETLHKVKGGELVPVEVSLNLTTYKGRLCHFGFIKNIAERKEVERKLLKAKEKAEAADRAKSQFLANMSHEIRTPMNAIIGMTGLTLDTKLSHEQRKYQQMVRDSANSLLLLINDILDFSKIEAGQIELEEESFDLRTAMEAVVNSLSVQAAHKGLELLCRIDPQVSTSLVGDSLRLGQVLINLTGNAIKFTEKGHVVLKAELEADEEGGICLHFSISDTGMGIPTEKQEAIFSRFTQADNSVTRIYGGTGLGLAISKCLVEMMGGRIWVESVPGQGSVFHFIARFQRNIPAAVVNIFAELEPKPQVLIVDDLAESRAVINDLVRAWGFFCQEAGDGGAALDILAAAAGEGSLPGLVFLDLDMPGIDGLQAARQIREDYGPEIPLIIMALGLAGDEVNGEIHGLLNCYLLTKPLNRSDLQRIMKIALLGGETAEVDDEPAEVAPVSSRASSDILLVEDNQVNRELAQIILGKLGQRVITAGNGIMALEILARGADNIDIILMDVQMPEMDGLSATRIIRACEQGEPGDYENLAPEIVEKIRERLGGRHIPIIALTAHAMPEDKEECLAAGMDNYLAKPIQDGQLASVLSKYVAVSSKPSTFKAGTDAGVPVESMAVVRPEKLRESLREKYELDDNDLDVIMDSLKKSIASNLANMERAIKKGDMAMRTMAAHSLKGVLSQVGVNDLADLAYGIEKGGIKNDQEIVDCLQRINDGVRFLL